MNKIKDFFSSLRILTSLLFALLALMILPKNDKGFAVLGKIARRINEEYEKMK